MRSSIFQNYARTFKNSFGREHYVVLDMQKHLRSNLAQFRCGIKPLRIETGRYLSEPVEERICTLFITFSFI